MAKKLLRLEIIGAVFSLAATLAIYFADIFFVCCSDTVIILVNILFFPVLLFAAAEYFIVGKRYKNYVFSKCASIIITSFLVQTMRLITAKQNIWAVSAGIILCCFISYQIIKQGRFLKKRYQVISSVMLILFYILSFLHNS